MTCAAGRQIADLARSRRRSLNFLSQEGEGTEGKLAVAALLDWHKTIVTTSATLIVQVTFMVITLGDRDEEPALKCHASIHLDPLKISKKIERFLRKYENMSSTTTEGAVADYYLWNFFEQNIFSLYAITTLLLDQILDTLIASL
ncbi:hypothetical protein ACJX0J_025948, partial [Zea mays]